MDKDIIYEPLLEARKSYLKYLEENGEKIEAGNKERYESQLKVIGEIIECLEKQPEKKEEITKLFEKM